MADDDEDRAAILARRNRLIAVALSGIGATVGCSEPAPPPQVCLSVVPADQVVLQPAEPTGPLMPEESIEAERAPPTPCLVPPAPDEQAGGEGDASGDGPQPLPCLTVALPEDEPEPVPEDDSREETRPELSPMPCLSPMPREKA